MKFINNKMTDREHKRIFKNISIDPVSGCWNWTGGKDQRGYGCVYFNKVRERIHRVMYSVFVKPVPRCTNNKRLRVIDHLCENTSCCNPTHLRLVTQKENILKGTGPSAINARKMFCSKGHEFPEYSGKSRRYCKVCDSERHKNRMNGPKREYWLQKAKEASKRYRDKSK